MLDLGERNVLFGGALAGPTSGCQGSRLAAFLIGVKYLANRRRLSRGKMDVRISWRVDFSSGSEGLLVVVWSDLGTNLVPQFEGRSG